MNNKLRTLVNGKPPTFPTLESLRSLMNGDVYPELERAAFEAAKTAAYNADPSSLDIHRITAALTFGVEPEDVTPEQRAHAKHRNFLFLYSGKFSPDDL